MTLHFSVLLSLVFSSFPTAVLLAENAYSMQREDSADEDYEEEDDDVIILEEDVDDEPHN